MHITDTYYYQQPASRCEDCFEKGFQFLLNLWWPDIHIQLNNTLINIWTRQYFSEVTFSEKCYFIDSINWKANLESKGLRVNVGKTKILVSAHNVPKPVDGSKFPCGVCNEAMRALGLTLSNAMPVAFGCINTVQTSRVL